MNEQAVLIAGGGPTGMMLAAELVLAGVEPLVVERRVGTEIAGSRSGGLHSRTIEVLDQRGIVGRFLAEGKPVQVQAFSGIPLDLSDFPTRHNHGLALWQKDYERIFNTWAEEIGVRVERGVSVVGAEQDVEAVDVALSNGTTVRAAWLVGCDGGRSSVRRCAGIGFPGWEPSVSSIVAEVEMSEEPPFGLRRDERGQQAIGRMADGRIRCVVTEPYVERPREATLDDLRHGLVAAYGSDFGVHSPTWISRFTDAARQADRYRSGRILLAGDSAHVHYPLGGQGLGIGVQDAVNLGWKLARVVKGLAPEALLDSYHDERHPVAARVLQNTLAQSALAGGSSRITALRDTLTWILALDEPRRHLAAMMSGLDVCYDLGGGHPMIGRRVPDMDVETDAGPTRIFELLHAARPVLLNLGRRGATDRYRDRVECVEGAVARTWELPVIGAVTAPEVVLIRPDGHVAWAGAVSDEGLEASVRRWFG